MAKDESNTALCFYFEERIDNRHLGHEEDYHHLCEVLAQRRNLRLVVWRQDSFLSCDPYDLVTSLRELSLDQLVLTHPHLGADVCKWLCDNALHPLLHQHLTRLSLCACPIGDEGLEAIAERLEDPGCLLEILNLHGCSLTALAYLRLGRALQSNERLRDLNVSGNDTRCGWVSFARLLQDNHTLHYFRGFWPTDAGADMLSAILYRNLGLPNRRLKACATSLVHLFGMRTLRREQVGLLAPRVFRDLLRHHIGPAVWQTRKAVGWDAALDCSIAEWGGGGVKH